MLVNILQTFDDANGKRRYAGENPDVDPAIARKWIADGRATSDPDNVEDPLGSTTLASTGLVTNSCPTFYYFGSSSTARSYDSTYGLAAWGYISRFHHRCNGGAVFIGASGIAGQDSAAQIARLPGVIAALTTRPKFFVLQIAGKHRWVGVPGIGKTERHRHGGHGQKRGHGACVDDAEHSWRLDCRAGLAPCGYCRAHALLAFVGSHDSTG